MFATYINCIAVIAGSLIGLLLKRYIKDSFKEIVFSSSGLVTIVLGIRMAIGTTNALAMILALVLGGLLGYLLRIEDSIMALGTRLEKLTARKGQEQSSDHSFAQGFMSASILFCSGAMTIVGSIQAGTTGDFETILVKSVMDGCMAVVFTTAYGIGVAFSSLFILLYQGFFTLAGSTIEPILGEVGIAEMAAVGGVLLLMIGLGLLKLKSFKTANYLPAMAIAPALAIWLDKIF
ncbi:MAG: DUF554 domain-containing protein [Sphaerochaetaceae bacterium]|jgi:uncharacterized membrane protein YqgA involved in biofilm formation|nr:DUF554 domain-containing protein [Sphaerochaetaceae bacterium]